MGKFKLGSPRVNPLKSRGFMNNSPFTANGNTIAYNKEEEETNKPAKSEEEAQNVANEQANKNVKNAEKKEVGRTSKERKGEQNGV